MGNLIFGVMILLSALKLTVGWIGLKLAYNRRFELAYFGGFIERPKLSEMPKLLRKTSVWVPNILSYLIRS